jgi:hypothetical protein
MAKYMAPIAKTKWKKPYPYGTSSSVRSLSGFLICKSKLRSEFSLQAGFIDSCFIYLRRDEKHTEKHSESEPVVIVATTIASTAIMKL